MLCWRWGQLSPFYSRAVSQFGDMPLKKLECANHACKCCRARLEKLAEENPSYKGKGGLTQKCINASLVLLNVQSKCVARRPTSTRHYVLWKGISSMVYFIALATMPAVALISVPHAVREKLHLTALTHSEEGEF